jgi:penicillin V acylase-like amidase (Ntn superfamily)
MIKKYSPVCSYANNRFPMDGINEIQGGKVAIFHGSQYRVLTNPPDYQTMLRAVAEHKEKGLRDVPGSLNAKDRFVRASDRVRPGQP